MGVALLLSVYVTIHILVCGHVMPILLEMCSVSTNGERANPAIHSLANRLFSLST